MRNLLFLKESYKYIQIRLRKKLAFIETITAILGIGGMILAIIENEIYLNDILYFDEARDSRGEVTSFTMRLRDIDENAFCTFLRVAIMSTSIAAAATTVLRYRYQLLYDKSTSKLDAHATLFSSKMYRFMLIECGYLLLHLPPRVNTNFSMQERGYYLEYSADIVITILMTGRIYLAMRVFGYFSKWSNQQSIQILQENRMQPLGMIFAIKAEMKVRPYLLTPVTIIVSLLLFGICLRWTELPFMHGSQMDWRSYASGLWCMLNTMTTVGYGDLTPGSNFGRIISVVAGQWGVFLFSLMVVSLSNSSQFTKHEARAFESARESKYIKKLVKGAVDVIVSAIRLYQQKKKEIDIPKASKYRLLSNKTEKLRAIFQRKIVAFKAFRRLMSTADFTETFESLVKKIETRLHAPFKELNARKKTYADILVSFYLTDVMQDRMEEKVNQLYRVYRNIYNKIQEFQNVIIDPHDEEGEESSSRSSCSSRSEAKTKIVKEVLQRMGDYSQLPRSPKGDKARAKEKTAQDYLKKLTATAITVAAEARKNPNIDIENYLKDIKRRDNVISNKIKKYSTGDVRSTISEQMPGFVEEDPDLENELSDEETEKERKIVPTSRTNPGTPTKLSTFSKFKPKKESPNNLENAIETSLLEPKKEEQTLDPLIKALEDEISEPVLKRFTDSSNDLKGQAEIERESKQPSLNSINVEKENKTNVNPSIELPLYPSNTSLVADIQNKSKDVSESHTSMKNIFDSTLNDSPTAFKDSKFGETSREAFSNIATKDPQIIHNRSQNIQNGSEREKSGSDPRGVSKVHLQEFSPINTNPLIKGIDAKIALTPQERSSSPSRALQDFLSADFLKNSPRDNLPSAKESSRLNETPASSERIFLINSSNTPPPHLQQRWYYGTISEFPSSDQPSTHRENLSSNRIDKSTSYQERSDSKRWVSQNDIDIASRNEDFSSFRLENIHVDQLVKRVKEPVAFLPRQQKEIKAQIPLQLMKQYLLGIKTPETKMGVTPWKRVTGPTQSEYERILPNLDVGSARSIPSNRTSDRETTRRHLPSGNKNYVPYSRTPEEKRDQTTAFDPKKWAANQLLHSGNTDKKSGADERNQKPSQGKMRSDEVSYQIGGNAIDRSDRIDFRKLLGLK